MSLNNYPDTRPSLLLHFAKTKRLDPRITFTRTTTATYYDGVTTAKAEENLLLQSQDFTTSWTNQNSTDTANTTVAPDGTTTADTITDDATSGGHFVFQNLAISINTTYTFSCWLQAGTSNYGYLAIVDRANGQRYFTADFDLSTGTVRTSDAGTSGTLTSSSITEFPAGSGWYRCVIIGQVAAVSATTAALVGVSDGTTTIGGFGTIVYAGTGSTIIAWGAQLEQRSAVSAYTPTTTAPITNYIPQLLTAPSGVARFNHNPTTGESLGLLVEEQRTNSILQSEDFTTTWSATRASITADTIVAPNGTLTGDKLVEDTTANNSHLVSQTSLSYTSGTTYSYSVYAKAAERTVVRLSLPSSAFGTSVAYNFDLVAGTATLVTAGTGNTASITAVGNGWYRCVVSAQATSTTNGTNQIFLIGGGFATYTGDGYSGAFIWGAQLEAGAFPTSYIPTVASSVTRNADAASMTGTNFSSWYRADEGTLFVDAITPPNLSTFPTVFSISDGTNQNRIAHYVYTSGFYVSIRSGNVDQGDPSRLVTPVAGQSYKFALGLVLNNAIAAANGVAGTADTSLLMPIGVNQARIGTNELGGGISNTTISKVAYYPARLSNAQLQALTTV